MRKLRLNLMLEKLWQYILVDLIIKLLVFRSYDAILVIYDRFLKISHFIVITKKVTAKRLARLFRDNMWKLHKLLESVILDRKSQSVVRLMKELNKILEIETKLSTTFYLQTNK